MTVSLWNLVLNSVDSVILVVLIWLIVTHRTDLEHHVHPGKNGGPGGKAPED